ncbi:hypothetical protein AGMMS4952_02340 [Spirochaetia bacterium]|nr:hypothetical protein AGMMS4952_02340 [Spirochaetia bacterium]
MKKKSNILAMLAGLLVLSFALMGCGGDDSNPTNGDTTAPVLSAGSVSVFEGTTAMLIFTSDEAGTYYYVVLASGDPAPAAATVKAQGTAVAKGTNYATASQNPIYVTGLTAGSTYKAYIVVEDESGNLSAVLTIDGVNPEIPYIDTRAELTAGSAVNVARIDTTASVTFNGAWNLTSTLTAADFTVTADGTIDTVTVNSGTVTIVVTFAENGTSVKTYTVRINSDSDTIKGSAEVTITQAGEGDPANDVLYVGNLGSPEANTGTLALALAWLKDKAVSDTAYTITLLSTTESLPSWTLGGSTSGSAANGKTGVTITLKGKDEIRTLQLTGTGSLFTVDSGVTLSLGENINLKGVNSNVNPLVRVKSGGTLELKDGAKISNNEGSNAGGGVYVDGGTFTMEGGEISENRATYDRSSTGGGVRVGSGTFTMKGGKISRNMGCIGGGVYVYGGTFTMEDGEISGNTAVASGYIYGGGVSVYGGTFTMKGGEISGNTVFSDYSYGGGVSVYGSGTFTMEGGTVYGSDGGAKANKLQGDGGLKRGVSLYKDSTATAEYGDNSAIITGTQSSALYTDYTLTGR